MTTPTFEENLAALETLVTTLEEGALPLHQALEAHARGIALVKACEDQLAQAEATLTTLTQATT